MLYHVNGQKEVTRENPHVGHSINAFIKWIFFRIELKWGRNKNYCFYEFDIWSFFFFLVLKQRLGNHPSNKEIGSPWRIPLNGLTELISSPFQSNCMEQEVMHCMMISIKLVGRPTKTEVAHENVLSCLSSYTMNKLLGNDTIFGDVPLETKLIWSGPTRIGRKAFNLLAIIFVIVLYITIQRLIRQNKALNWSDYQFLG